MIARLTRRALVRLDGDEAAAFLNDLITASTTDLDDGAVRPAALLTPQGRVLFDLLVSRDGGAIRLEVDADRRDLLIRKMTMYRMRRAVEISPEDCPVHGLDRHLDGALADPRFDGEVFRFYGDLPEADGPGADADDAAWQAFRYRHAVAEGAEDLPPEKALPLEARLDRHGGINFDKGCYIGQEVTARTRYRGLLKRGYMAVTSEVAIAAPCDLEQNGKNAGHLLAMVAAADGWIGLASIRLEALDNDAAITAEGQPLTVITT